MQFRFCSTAIASVVALTASVLISGAVFAADPAPASPPQVELKTTMGTIVLELYPDAAPKTVKNFLDYVKSGFYNGTIFHRVIDNFMIQGGGLDKNLKEKKGNPPIPLEAKMAFDHGLKNDIGTIAMAREEKPNTATSEFFINVADNDFLNPATLPPTGDPITLMRRGTMQTKSRAEWMMISAGYTPFGRVIDGMDVVNKIKVQKTAAHGENLNLPLNTVTVISAKILKTHVVPKSIDEQLGVKPAEPVSPVEPVTPAEPVTPMERPVAPEAPASAPAQTN